MKHLNLGTKQKLSIVTAVVVIGVIGGGATVANQKNAGADTSPLVTEVDHQNDKLNNHEARISNLESDTKTLQANTNTNPSSSKVAVPTVRDVTASSSATATSAPASEPTTQPVVVTAFREIVIDPDTSDCEYTYSDGSTHQFAWKQTNPQGSWMTDGNGQNGHWLKTTTHNGFCDNRALGQPKL